MSLSRLFRADALNDCVPRYIPRRVALCVAVWMLFATAIAAWAVSPRESLRQLCAAADQGNPKALYDLAYLYDIGYDSIPRDSVRSTELYLRAAEAGYLPACNYIGFRMIRGEGGVNDPEQGLEWLRRAAVKGDAKAANNLGWLLMDGSLVERNYEDAAFWFQKSADAGLPVAMSHLGDLYRLGHGVPADTLKAEALYTRAIENGLHDAELKLISMMHESWLETDASEALALARKFISIGAPAAGVSLAEMAASSAENRLRSLSSDAEEMTDETAVGILADADAILADAYSRGYGVGYDHERAMTYFVRSAVLGNRQSRKALSELLEILPDSLTPYYDVAVGICRIARCEAPSEESFSDPAYWTDTDDDVGLIK